MARKSKENSSLRIGYVSRIDCGSSGFRMGLLKLAAETFKREKVHFVVVAGGLVSYKPFREQIKAGKASLREKIRNVSDKNTKRMLKEELEKFEDDFIDRWVHDLVVNFPHIRDLNNSSKSWVKWYIVTSPGYDGEIGNVIAHRLARKREDIVHWAHGSKNFSTEVEGRDVAVLTPKKTPWLRGKYHSTPVERVILDWNNENYEEDPHDLVVGCCGSLLQKPGNGEASIPYVALPVLCRLWDTRMGSENQVGVVVMEYTVDNKTLVRGYNYNDIVARQNEFIRPPRGVNVQERQIIKLLKEHGSQTTGQLAYYLGLGRRRKELRKDLASLLAKSATKHWPGLVFDDASGLYDFNPEWLETKLTFPYPKKKIKEDSLVAFGCLHAGCVHTNYDYFINKLPQLIMEQKADVLVGAGDFTEGLKHNLILRGDVFGGFNQTDQEEWAGIFVGEVMLRVFKARMDNKLSRRRSFCGKKLKEAINCALIDFVYIYGNHCAWTQDSGFDPLGIFRVSLLNQLTKGIEDYLRSKKLNCNGGVRGLVSRHVIEQREGQDDYSMPSGLKMEIYHPWMSRTLTQSIRPQQTLAFANSHVVVSANFHVAIGVGDWKQSIGQRYGLQVGTVKDRSSFEGHKLKKLDTGSGCLRVVSRGGRIWMTETIFDTAQHTEPLDNNDLKILVYKKFGVKVYPKD